MLRFTHKNFSQQFYSKKYCLIFYVIIGIEIKNEAYENCYHSSWQKRANTVRLKFITTNIFSSRKSCFPLLWTTKLGTEHAQMGRTIYLHALIP